MIVSCESCKSRYKLDDSKITGRGAKITCPKCKHVFVVLAPPPSAAEAPKPTMLPQSPGSEWEDDEPTRVGREATAISAAPPSAPPAAPPAAPASTAPVTAPEHEVIRPRSAPANTAPPSKEEIAARAAALDFRKVGVTAWKVKVRIGLVYDFSDIKTLRKYIQDGRVTSADVISHDGKSWKPIGDIPDLDAFFVESYEVLEKEYASKAPPERSGPAPADLGNVAAALAAAAAAELDAPPTRSGRTEPTGPVYTDPFEAMKQRQRDRGPGKKGQPAKPAKNNTTTILLAVMVLVVLAAGGWWWMGHQKPEVVPEKPVVTKPVKAPVPTPTLVPVETPDLGVGDAGSRPSGGSVAAPQLDENCIKYIQGKCVTGAVGPTGGSGGGGSTKPAGGGGGVATPAGGGGPTVTSKATDNMQIGDDFMRQHDYNSAVTAYSSAVAEGKPGANVKLGEAQWRAGDQAGGGSTLMSAAGGNPKAWKVLGQLKEEAGDKAGAKDAYTSYLKSNPKDAAVKARVEALGG